MKYADSGRCARPPVHGNAADVGAEDAVAAGEPNMATATRPGALWAVDPYEEPPELPAFRLQPRQSPEFWCPECWALGTGYGTFKVKMLVVERVVTSYEIWLWLECPVCGCEDFIRMRRF